MFKQLKNKIDKTIDGVAKLTNFAVEIEWWNNFITIYYNSEIICEFPNTDKSVKDWGKKKFLHRVKNLFIRILDILKDFSNRYDVPTLYTEKIIAKYWKEMISKDYDKNENVDILLDEYFLERLNTGLEAFRTNVKQYFKDRF